MIKSKLSQGLVNLFLVLALAACGGGSSDGSGSSSGGGNGGSGGGSNAQPSQIRILSNRADLISGGDALVEVVWPSSASVSTAKMTLNGQDVTSMFAMRANGRYMGLLGGLALGNNEVVATASGASRTVTTIINHPNGGPVFSGPQIQPWECADGTRSTREMPIFDACNQPAEYTFLYKSTNPTKPGLQPYDPANPPSDVATTTTDEGVTLPFIVRQERGYQDRDEYKILMLYKPDQPWLAWAPQEQWNHKLFIPHGGSCGGDHRSGSAPLNDYSGTLPANPLENSYIIALGRGFGVMSTALNNTGHNCNVITIAESLVMAKERVVEQYGELRYTIGSGCSGGSIAQNMVANAYPGIYQGLLTTCSYPDVGSTAVQFLDYHLLRRYFENPSKWGTPWSPSQFADVEGHIAPVNAIAADEAFFKGVTDPSAPCDGVTDAERYHARDNPAGVRCGVLDYAINLLGPRPEVTWSDMEKAAKLQNPAFPGFAGVPLDNVGVQYGLNALREGKITPAQFVDLNEKIGGLDVDFKPQPQRMAADQPALANIYRSGETNETNNLNQSAIINFTGPDPGIAHDAVHAWWTRWRLDREHGNHDNHVMWGGPFPVVGDGLYVQQSLLAMDRWLAAVEQDTSARPMPEKITVNKPADIHDQCSNGAGQKVLDTVCPDSVGGVYGTPRTVAGADKTADNMKCELRPMDRNEYGPIGLTDAEWARLQAVFPQGVCDYSKPGVSQQPAIAWMHYGDAVTPVYGGTPLPATPANSAGGLTSPAFAYGY